MASPRSTWRDSRVPARQITGFRTPERALKDGFTRGVLAVLALFIGIAGFVRLANLGHQRPEGRAERWLNAVADTTRKGVRSDATARATAIGDPRLADQLLPSPTQTRQKSAFTDLEVGEAHTVDADTVRVPFRLHQRSLDGPEPQVTGTLVLNRVGGDWRVVAVRDRDPADGRVPSEGGSPPSKAPVGLFVVALGIGGIVTVAASAVVRAAGRGSVFDTGSEAQAAPLPSP